MPDSSAREALRQWFDSRVTWLRREARAGGNLDDLMFRSEEAAYLRDRLLLADACPPLSAALEAAEQLERVQTWLRKANAPGDEGCDYLNDDGWDHAEQLQRDIDAMFERHSRRRAAGKKHDDAQ